MPVEIATTRHEDLPSQFIQPRNVDVWLPPGYETSRERYPVLYMQDGQNLFDPKLSYSGVTWGVAEAITRLASKGQIRPAIVVGIWNTPARIEEYLPEKAVNFSEERRKDFAEYWVKDLEAHGMSVEEFPVPTPQSDAYLRFMVEELKPIIDDTYRTQPGQQTTFISGSSMGGLISIYALCEYPEVFGGAACVSTAWPVGDGITLIYLDEVMPYAGQHRVYFDHGTTELDAEYGKYQKLVDGLMINSGYKAGQDWETKVFLGHGHQESAWRERIDFPLTFLLGK